MANMFIKGIAYLMGAGNWADGGTTIKMALVTSAYTYSDAHNFFDDITNEITNGGYSAGGVAMTTRVVNEDDGASRGAAESDDVLFASLAAGDQPFAAVIYRDTGTPATSELVAFCALTAPPAPNGGNYTINQPAVGWFNFAN